MKFSQVLPSRFATVLAYSILFLAWLPPEGNIVLVVGFGWLTAGILILRLARRWLDQLALQLKGWLFAWGAIGVAIGTVAPWIVLALMTLKTGIHAHGPEYTPAEINWVVRQWLIWIILGGGIGFGYGLLAAGWLGMQARAR